MRTVHKGSHDSKSGLGRAWGDGLVVKNTSCPSRRPRLNSQFPHDTTTICNLVPENLMPSPGICEHYMNVHRHKCTFQSS